MKLDLADLAAVGCLAGADLAGAGAGLAAVLATGAGGDAATSVLVAPELGPAALSPGIDLFCCVK